MEQAEYEGIRSGLVQLADISKQLWEIRLGEGHEGPWILGELMIFEFLDKILPESVDELPNTTLLIPPAEAKTAIFPLPPLDAQPDIICLLSLKWNLNAEVNNEGTGGSTRSFRLIMLLPHEDRHVPFGFRLDDSETNQDWCFPHFQVSNLMTPYEERVGRPHTPLPSRIPRIPVGVTSGGVETLLVVLVAGLYGVSNEVFRLVVRHLRGDRAKAFAEMLQSGIED